MTHVVKYQIPFSFSFYGAAESPQNFGDYLLKKKKKREMKD
jgi:hypothetical protein